jgi:hypothetical protein
MMDKLAKILGNKVYIIFEADRTDFEKLIKEIDIKPEKIINIPKVEEKPKTEETQIGRYITLDNMKKTYRDKYDLDLPKNPICMLCGKKMSRISIKDNNIYSVNLVINTVFNEIFFAHPVCKKQFKKKIPEKEFIRLTRERLEFELIYKNDSRAVINRNKEYNKDELIELIKYANTNKNGKIKTSDVYINKIIQGKTVEEIAKEQGDVKTSSVKNLIGIRIRELRHKKDMK